MERTVFRAVLFLPIFYLEVCLLSALMAALTAHLAELHRQNRFQKGRAWVEVDKEDFLHNVREPSPMNCSVDWEADWRGCINKALPLHIQAVGFSCKHGIWLPRTCK